MFTLLQTIIFVFGLFYICKLALKYHSKKTKPCKRMIDKILNEIKINNDLFIDLEEQNGYKRKINIETGEYIDEIKENDELRKRKSIIENARKECARKIYEELQKSGMIKG